MKSSSSTKRNRIDERFQTWAVLIVTSGSDFENWDIEDKQLKPQALVFESA